MKNLQIARPDENGTLSYGIFDAFGNSKFVEGNPAVEQLVAKLLLTDIGSSLFDPTSGGSLRARALDDTITQANLRTKISGIGRSIMLVEEQIRASQQGLNLPPSERLLRIDMENISFEFESRTWNIRLLLKMEDGNVLRQLLT